MTLSPAEIRALRKEWKLTQAELSSVMGLWQETVSRWETGQTTPDPQSMRLLIAYTDGYRPADWPEKK